MLIAKHSIIYKLKISKIMKNSSKLISVAMKHQVSRMEKKFGDLDKHFWSEDKKKYY